LPYQKFKADYLFNGYQLLNQQHVLITDEKGKVIGIVDEKDAGDDIQYFNGILSPGFINCHCHLELSHLKGLIPRHTGLVNFVFKVVTQHHPADNQAGFSEEEILLVIANAEDEMIANGIVAVGDICNNTSTLLQKTKQRLAYYNFIEVSGWLPQIAQQKFEKSKEYYDAFSRLSSANSQLSIAPHAPYSVSNDLWELINPFFQNKTTTLHNQETAFEDNLFINGTGDFRRMYEMMKLDNSFFKPTGKSSIQSIYQKLEGAQNVLLVHNTFINEPDIEILNLHTRKTTQQFFYCLCVIANTYIENALPPVDLLRNRQCNIVIGTDSLASNTGLSILDELKAIRKHFPHIRSNELLQWSTINGAKALQMDDTFGSFETKKRPGIVLIDHTENGEITGASSVKRIV